MAEHLNLLVTIDKNYVAPLITMLISYGEVHKGICTDVYIAHSALAGFLPVDAGMFCLVTRIARIPSILSSTLCGANLAEQQYKDSVLIFLATMLIAVIFGIIAYMKTKTGYNETVCEE